MEYFILRNIVEYSNPPFIGMIYPHRLMDTGNVITSKILIFVSRCLFANQYIFIPVSTKRIRQIVAETPRSAQETRLIKWILSDRNTIPTAKASRAPEAM